MTSRLLTRSAALTRRQLFSRTALGAGSAALASLLEADVVAASAPPRSGGVPGVPHYRPKARSVIYLLMNGAPPHVDMFDYKPELEKWRGREIPESVHKNQRV